MPVVMAVVLLWAVLVHDEDKQMGTSLCFQVPPYLVHFGHHENLHEFEFWHVPRMYGAPAHSTVILS